MLGRVEVCKLILNEYQIPEQQRAIVDWHYKKLAEDQKAFPGALISLDVEVVQSTVLDVLRRSGMVEHAGDLVQLSGQPWDGA